MSHDISHSANTIPKEHSTQFAGNLATDAASFFVRVGKKCTSATNDTTMSIKKKKKTDHCTTKSDFLTNFSEILKNNPPPVPPSLFKTTLNRPLGHNVGKIKVIVRLKYVDCTKPGGSQSGSPSQSFITVDGSKKQITVVEPQSATSTPRRTNTCIPKIFAFDAVYTDDDDMTELCSNALTDIIQAVVNGSDGCVFSFGHLRAVSAFTIIGSDQHTRKLGIIPCAISWLFRLISEQKDKTGARFSVRVSAIEVHGKQETLKDLLSDVDVIDAAGHCSSGVYLREDPVYGTQLQNQSELRAPTAEKAAFYLDTALAARPIASNEEDARLSHFLFTLHVYQYRVERGTQRSAVAGGRSRLHMLDFASGGTVNESTNRECEPMPTDYSRKESQSLSTALSLSATSAVLLALVNGQRHIPHRTSKLSQLLREAMGNLSCRTCMIVHVAMNNSHFVDNMQIIQFASKMQRLKRRKLSKFSGTSSDDSSCDSFSIRRASRIRNGNMEMSLGSVSNGMTSSEADYTSSSDQSCNTVIYLGDSSFKDAEEHSSSTLRKRKISEPHFPKTISKRSGSESDMTKIDVSRHPLMTLKSSLRTNSLAWSKAAAKNAVETLSTQKEMWVDGPNAVFVKKIREKNVNIISNNQKFVNSETQTYLLEESVNTKETQSNLSDLSLPIHSNSQEINIHSKTSSYVDNTATFDGLSAFAHKFDSSNILEHEIPCHKTQISNTSSTISTNLKIGSSEMIASASQASQPLVWDWVEKHGDMLSCSPLVKDSVPQSFQFLCTEKSQSPQKKSAKHCSKHQQSLIFRQVQPALNIDRLECLKEKEGWKHHKSAKLKNTQSPFVYDSNFIISPNNQSTEPSYIRVAEWVKSVSDETSRTQSLSPIRRNNKDNENNTPSAALETSTVNYYSLDRQDPMGTEPLPSSKYTKHLNESFDKSTSFIQYSCKPLPSKAQEPSPPAQLQSQLPKLWQDCVKSGPKLPDSTSHVPHSKPKKTNAQVEEASISQHKLNPVKSNKNSPSRQITDHSSPNKTRSSSLFKNAIFGRCRLSSSNYNNNDETNLYSVPNSPFKSKVCSEHHSKGTECSPVSNTSGYQYVVMTSSVNTTIKHNVDESGKISKKRPSSASPEKTCNLSYDKKHSVAPSINKRDKNKEKINKECQTEPKTKSKKESRKKLNFLTSPLFGKRKEKDKCVLPIPKQQKPKRSVAQMQHDSSNSERPSKVISPYRTVTQPKPSIYSSSGHGSDCSSLYGHHQKYGDVSSPIKCREYTHINEVNPCLPPTETNNVDQHTLLRRSQRRGGGHTSSGYESIMRDSEVSSQNDSTSESSLGVVQRAQTPEKQQSQSSSSSSKQSHSAPNRSEETSEDTQSPVSVRKMSPKSIQKCQLKSQQQRENEKRKIAKQIMFEKIYDILAQQDMLKTELMQAKDRILVEPSSWSYDLHVVEQMDPEDSSFIEALEKETDILRKRVDACKSHVLLLTYFDCRYTNQLSSDTFTPYPYQISHQKSVSVGTAADQQSTTNDLISSDMCRKS